MSKAMEAMETRIVDVFLTFVDVYYFWGLFSLFLGILEK